VERSELNKRLKVAELRAIDELLDQNAALLSGADPDTPPFEHAKALISNKFSRGELKDLLETQRNRQGH